MPPKTPRPFTAEELAKHRRTVAADLRKLEHYDEPWPRMMATIDAKDAEIVRLREALEPVVEAYLDDHGAGASFDWIAWGDDNKAVIDESYSTVVRAA